MKNIYNNEKFFESYSQMTRSQQGLDGAGEWQTLKRLLPDFKKKRVLDLGCGYGWHCLYAAEHGAASVIGVDISEKMLEVARKKIPLTIFAIFTTALIKSLLSRIALMSSLAP